MIQEIPDKICKKCGSTRWRSFISNKTEYLKCYSCEYKAVKYKKPKPLLEGPCRTCGNPDVIIKVRAGKQAGAYLDGTPFRIRHCKICQKREDLLYQHKISANLSTPYVKAAIAQAMNLKVSDLKITPEQCEEYRQSLLLHRKLNPLKHNQMSKSKTKQLTNFEQVTQSKNNFFRHSNTLQAQFDATGDIAKIKAAASLARVHRLYLRDEILLTSTPTK